MAKSKPQISKSKTSRIDDDEDQMKSRPEPADEEAVDADGDDADKEAAEVDVEDTDDEATEVDVEDADAEAEATGESGDVETPQTGEGEESADEGPVAPPAKITITALVLILLNLIAAPTFLIFAYLDIVVRTQYSYRTMLNYIQVWGLPLKSEDNADSLSNETRPLIVLTPKQLQTAFNKRPGVKGEGKEFAPFEETLDKRIPFLLRPRDLSPQLLEDVFQGQAEKVATLDEEIERLQKKLEGDIQDAANGVKDALAKKSEKEKLAVIKKALSPFSWDAGQAKKLEAQIDETKGADLDALAKRAIIRNVLFTIAWDVNQVKKLEDRLEKAKGAELDSLFDDAVQRRIYYDILAPVNVFRPGDIKDVKNYKIERLSDLDAYKLDQVKEFMQQRLKALIANDYDLDIHIGAEVWNKAQENPDPEALKRDTIEKRQTIAFLLFTLSQVGVPALDKQLLYSNGVERAQIVCGLHEFTNASIHYVHALRVLEERVRNSVVGDREGHPHVLVELLKLTPEEFIGRFDKDNDKKLSRDEFGTSLSKTFAAADKDGDGKLDREEVAGLQALFRKNPEVTRTDGFIDEYENEIDRLVEIAAQIDSAQKRLADLKLQQDHFQKIYNQRAAQHKSTLEDLLKARRNTEKYVKDLRELQDQLHAALQDLSEASDRNFELFAQIRALEQTYQNQKTKRGGKKQP
jgi:hypothetical protein